MERIRLFQVHKIPHTRFLEETLNSGFYAEGPRVAEFESRLADVVGNKFTVTVNSGTAALYLALYMSGVGPGKAVITTPITSPATNISIPRLGGNILWADVDPQSGNICPRSVGRLLDRYPGEVAAALCRIAVAWDHGSYPPLEYLGHVARDTRIGRRIARSISCRRISSTGPRPSRSRRGMRDGPLTPRSMPPSARVASPRATGAGRPDSGRWPRGAVEEPAPPRSGCGCRGGASAGARPPSAPARRRHPTRDALHAGLHRLEMDDVEKRDVGDHRR